MVETGWLDGLYSLKDKKVMIAGASGLVGSALMRRLKLEKCLLLAPARCELDCRDERAVLSYMNVHKPDVVIVAAAKVGGIQANINEPAIFFHENMQIASALIDGAYKAGVEKLLYLGSSCIYPKDAPNPIQETALLSGSLEPTNAPYALAKIAGIQMCQSYRAQYGCDFISALPCNLYGPGDCFDLENSHVLPALVMKAHAAKVAGSREMEIWGSGRPRREFLYVDDLADALVFLLQHYNGALPINVGAGEDMSIRTLAKAVARSVGFGGALVFDAARPDGVARKLMDSSRIQNAGWSPQISLDEGLKMTYAWYLAHISKACDAA